jgi:septal ring factor EnvC (AmiA/AmiB activator)
MCGASCAAGGTKKGGVVMATEPLLSGCALLAHQIKGDKKDIANKERRIKQLRERIGKLQAQLPPDTAAIAEARADIDRLEKQLVSDRAQLELVQEEFMAVCR